jgi:hypothetical protein
MRKIVIKKRNIPKDTFKIIKDKIISDNTGKIIYDKYICYNDGKITDMEHKELPRFKNQKDNSYIIYLTFNKITIRYKLIDLLYEVFYKIIPIDMYVITYLRNNSTNIDDLLLKNISNKRKHSNEIFRDKRAHKYLKTNKLDYSIELKDAKEIKDFPGYYILKNGHVFSTHRNLYCKRFQMGTGSVRVALSKNDRIINFHSISSNNKCRRYSQYHCFLYKLLYRTYIGEIPNTMKISYKNGDITDVRLDNLILVPKIYKNNHYFSTFNNRAILQYDKSMNLINRYESTRELFNKNPTINSFWTIDKACINNNLVYGHYFRYETKHGKKVDIDLSTSPYINKYKNKNIIIEENEDENDENPIYDDNDSICEDEEEYKRRDYYEDYHENG